MGKLTRRYYRRENVGKAYKLGKHPLESKNPHTSPSFAGFPAPASHLLIWSVVNHARTEAGRLRYGCSLHTNMFPQMPGIRSGYLPLARPSVLGNPLRIMTWGQIQPLILRTRKNAPEVPQNYLYERCGLQWEWPRMIRSSGFVMTDRASFPNESWVSALLLGCVEKVRYRWDRFGDNSIDI